MNDVIILTWQMFDENGVENVFTFYGEKDLIKYITLSINMAQEIEPTREQMVSLRSDVRNKIEDNFFINDSRLGLILEEWAFSSNTMPKYNN
jgi:hypothetical protein